MPDPSSTASRLASIACVLAFGLALLAAQSPARFGDTVYRLPPGWRAAEQKGSLVVTPPNVPAGQEVAVLVLPGQARERDFRNQFDRIVRALSSNEAMPEYGDVQGQRAAAGYDVLTEFVQTGPRANRVVRLYIGASPGDRFEMALAVASSANAYRRYEAEIREFLGSLDYPAAREASLPETTPAPAVPSPRADSTGTTPGLPSLPRLQARPGWAIGRAVDARGGPLEDFEVTIRRGAISTFGRVASDTIPGRNGRYEVQLPRGTFLVIGYATVRYEGQVYRMELYPLDGREWNQSSPSEPGIVKDFVLVGSGLRAGQQPDEWGSSCIGGAITVEDGTFSLPTGTMAEVTLTPIGPLLDGSPGRVITRSGRIVFTVTDVPLGKYSVSVRIGGRPVDFELRHTSGGPNVGRGPLVFMPNEVGVEGTRRVRLLIR